MTDETDREPERAATDADAAETSPAEADTAEADAAEADAAETDDDALSWEGDEELGRTTGLRTPDGGSDPADPVAVATPARPASQRILGIVFLVLAVVSVAGWVLVILGNPVQQPSLLGLVMYQLGEYVALLTPVLWWIAVSRLVRGAGARAGWWIAGLVVTAPWTLLVGVLA